MNLKDMSSHTLGFAVKSYVYKIIKFIYIFTPSYKKPGSAIRLHFSLSLLMSDVCCAHFIAFRAVTLLTVAKVTKGKKSAIFSTVHNH
jgi:hypothetical protein